MSLLNPNLHPKRLAGRSDMAGRRHTAGHLQGAVQVEEGPLPPSDRAPESADSLRWLGGDQAAEARGVAA